MIVDLHTHCLFGIDDGAQTLEDSLSLLKAQESSGVDCVVCSPHFLYSSKEDYLAFLKKRDQHLSELQKNYSGNLILATEILFSVDLLEADLQPLTINQSRYLLIEFSTSFAPNHLVDRMDDLLGQGYIVILAHVERYPYLIQNKDLMIELIDKGVLFQMNASTIVNTKHQKLVSSLIKQNLIHLIASDCHNLSSRKPNLMEAYQVIEEHYGLAMRDYFVHNAQCVVNDQEVVVKEVRQTKGFLRFFKRK